MKIQMIIIFFIVINFLSFSTKAQTQETLTDKLSRCAKITDNLQRLTCFDTVTESISALPSHDIDRQNNEENVVTAKQIDDFAKDDLKKTKEEQGPDSIYSTISNTKQLIRGEWVIDLENGQKWQQTDTVKMKFSVGDDIRLKKGSLGSVFLFKENSNRGIRVKRLK